MPKIVDHQKRKEQIAEAVWRVICRSGMDSVSVRTVASEAGMSLGSLRHYFSSQSELFAFSMRLVSERANRRIAELKTTGNPRRDIEMVIAELLPLDEVRRTEAKVWLAFAGKSVSDPDILALNREVHEQLYAGIKGMLTRLAERGLAAPGIDPDLETKRLHALVDGLVVHHASFPEQITAEEMVRIVARHLDGLMSGG